MCFKKIRNYFKKRSPAKTVQVENPDTVTDNDISTQTDTVNINSPFMPTTNTDQQSAATTLSPEFVYLEELIRYRLNKDFPSQDNKEVDDSEKVNDIEEPPFPVFSSWKLPVTEFVMQNNLENNQDELTLLLIGLMPHIQPDFFDDIIQEKVSGDFARIGGVRGKNCRFFLPTGETVLYIIAGDDLDRRLQVQQLFGAEHLFWEKKITWLEDMQNGEPSMHGRLIISPDYIDLLTYGLHKSPQFSISFPAKKIAPGKEGSIISFEQLVIPKELQDQIDELKSWLKYNKPMMAEDFGMSNKFRKGYRTLFYGPPGTGKTFTAQILGNDLKKEVYKIDLSMIVSKYIGETEKNLELLFARAEDKGWILFFDEADALFGKRTNVRDAHDKYANQEVSYLLQRIEDYDGLVILATNMKNNIDDAFIRRFNSILKFSIPNAEDRKSIWDKLFPPKEKRVFYDNSALDNPQEIDILEKVKKYELSGGNINNVVHYASLKAYERRSIKVPRNNCSDTPRLAIYLDDVINGIRNEFVKEGKPFTA